MNIIGDIAGRFDELMLLLDKMPKDELIVLVGDLMDRGPKSKEVIEWAMNTPNVISIYGNHEDMMVDFYEDTKKYEEGVWLDNGGNTTIKSYGIKLYPGKPSNIERIKNKVPKQHIEWLKDNPKFIEKDGVYISHAPWPFELGEGSNHDDCLWNRYPPSYNQDFYQIFGHNSKMQEFGISGKGFAICIDNSNKKELCGIHWPSKQIYIQEYLK